MKTAAAISICSLAFAVTFGNASAQSLKGNDPGWERIAEAKAAASDTKPKQCFADANVWFAEAEKGLEIPTVDLLRRKYEMDVCYASASRLNSRKRGKAVLLTKIESVTYRYTYELFIRAKNILADHELLNEFLGKER